MFDFQNSGLTPELVTDRAEKNAFLLQEALDGFSSFDGSTGWVDIDSCADQALLQRISRKAAQIREEADLFILIGVGGSNNAARSVIEALRPGGVEICYAGNATAPSSMEYVLEQMEGKSVFVNIIAKNFETLEPGDGIPCDP